MHADSLAFLVWDITEPRVADTLELIPLLDRLGAPPGDVYADAGYLASNNVQHIVALGGTPYVKPRRNTRGRPPRGAKDQPAHRTSEAFRDMVDAYRSDAPAWLRRYGARNGIESAWSGLKRRFGGQLAATGDRMKRVEAGLKVLAWNLTRVPRYRHL